MESPSWLGAFLHWTPSTADLSLHFSDGSCALFGLLGDTNKLLWYLRMAVAGEGGDEKLAGASMGLPRRGGGLRFTQLALGHIVSGRVKACI